jgi:hypothetical protein
MTLTNRQSGTNVVEIADGIYRINTPVAIEGAGGFSFNQYLIVDDEPLLFHTGLRKLFPPRSRIFSDRARNSATKLTTSRTRPEHARCWRDWPPPSPQPSHACTVALGMVTGQSFCLPWPMS